MKDAPPHAHFICRSCFSRQCDHGDGKVEKVCACGAASWAFIPATGELLEATYPSEELNAHIYALIVVALRKNIGDL